VVGLRRGRAEYGPRALGNASVLAHPGLSTSFARVNAFKQREPFRPYAPSVLRGSVADWFDVVADSPFMSFSSTIREDKLPQVQAVAHVDGSARYQTVEDDDGLYAQILRGIEKACGVPVVLNTSFNRAGEPIVETPGDAVRAFVESSMDALALGPYFIEKQKESTS
jgi:carbamoyltransferase